jgi:hypothetical protein
MQQKFKRHQKVKILIAPNEEYVEYYADTPVKITKGMSGKINLFLPNGQYHVEIVDKKGNVIAYAPFNEEDLEAEE